jgi:aspartate aminotransferase
MQDIQTSQRLKELPMSAIRKLVPYATKAIADGVKIYKLNIGDPDIKTPECMLDVLRNWNMNPIRYAAAIGEPELLKALHQYYLNLGYDFISQDHIISTIGGSEGIFMALFSVAQAGDEVLIFEPFFANYAITAGILGVKLVPIPTVIEDGFHLPSKEVIEKLFTKKTKAIIYCNPSNPTGTVYTKKEVEMLVDIAKRKNVFLMCDEVYREFVFVKRPFVSILDYFKVIPQQAILIDSLSKRYSLCGARLGILITLNEELKNGFAKIANSRLSGGLVDQLMAAKMTDVGIEYTQNVQKEYRLRRDTVFNMLRDIPGVVVCEPEGAFYIIAKLPVKSSEEFCIWMLEKFRDEKETVMMSPAAGFYLTPGKGSDEVRIAYVLEVPKLKRAITLLKKGLEAYTAKGKAE